jgi:hypothetical protein
MKKNDIIKDILESAKIHHNIRIDWNRSRKAIEKANLTDEQAEKFNTDMDIEGNMIEMFIDDFSELPINDSGNRNLCGCNKVIYQKDDFKKNNGYNGRAYIDKLSKWMSYDEAKKAGLIDKRTSEDMRLFTKDGACRKHDLWHIYQHGRMGATLYWDKYWNSNNSGFSFKYDEYELAEMDITELKTILSEITEYNNKIDELMENYYAELEYQAKEHKQNCIDAEKQAKYDKLIAPYNVNLYELSKEKDNTIKRQAISLIKLLNIK